VKQVKVILSEDEGYRVWITDEDYDSFQCHLQSAQLEPLDSTEIEELASLAVFGPQGNGQKH